MLLSKVLCLLCVGGIRGGGGGGSGGGGSSSSRHGSTWPGCPNACPRSLARSLALKSEEGVVVESRRYVKASYLLFNYLLYYLLKASYLLKDAWLGLRPALLPALLPA
jgi:hypothetical protein